MAARGPGERVFLSRREISLRHLRSGEGCRAITHNLSAPLAPEERKTPHGCLAGGMKNPIAIELLNSISGLRGTIREIFLQKPHFPHQEQFGAHSEDVIRVGHP
jgi:hypothetical protein